MNQKRLNGLFKIHVHRGLPEDERSVAEQELNKFARKECRKIQFTF